MVFEVFGIRVTDFLSIAFRWLCNTRHLQFNFVSYAIIWSIWNNRNSIIFNRKTRLNSGVTSSFVLSDKLEDPVQKPNLDKSGSFCRDVGVKTQIAAGTEARLICKSFGWITSWGSTVAGAQHGGRVW
jgi:hypothetical protein